MPVQTNNFLIMKNKYKNKTVGLLKMGRVEETCLYYEVVAFFPLEVIVRSKKEQECVQFGWTKTHQRENIQSSHLKKSTLLITE